MSRTMEEELLVSARKGDIREVERLLRLGVSPNCTGGDGEFPLILAQTSRGPDKPSNIQAIVTAALLDAGATVDQRSPSGTTALIMAGLMGHEEVVELLLSRGADPNAREGLTDGGCAGGYAALHYAAGNGYAGVVKRLLHHGADVNLPRASDEFPLLPLDLACRPPLRDREPVIELLIAAGARRSGHQW